MCVRVCCVCVLCRVPNTQQQFTALVALCVVAFIVWCCFRFRVVLVCWLNIRKKVSPAHFGWGAHAPLPRHLAGPRLSFWRVGIFFDYRVWKKSFFFADLWVSVRGSIATRPLSFFFLSIFTHTHTLRPILALPVRAPCAALFSISPPLLSLCLSLSLCRCLSAHWPPPPSSLALGSEESGMCVFHFITEGYWHLEELSDGE